MNLERFVQVFGPVEPARAVYLYLIVAAGHLAEPHLDRLRRLLSLELHLAAAIERRTISNDGEPTIIGTRLDPRANSDGVGSQRDCRRNGDRQRFPSTRCVRLRGVARVQKLTRVGALRFELFEERSNATVR